MRNVFLGLGSNLGDRSAYLREAIRAIPGEKAVSSVYETEPVGGPAGQGPYLNIVVRLVTDQSATELLELCHDLENKAGRVRRERNGARTLDVDILFIEGETIATSDLVVPHPRMWGRKFVLAPLRDLEPDLVSEDDLQKAAGEVRKVAVI
ncbi:MAG: 2-amino-4-hydroxy-6-hydroxymethyldihydropteridine diphosphokinase [Acidimicrobiales bacterium]